MRAAAQDLSANKHTSAIKPSKARKAIPKHWAILRWTPWEVRIATTHSVYSREFPHLELETEVPGTVFTVSDRPLHHIGYWTDDLTGESAALEEQGMPLVAGAEVGGSLYGMAFHRTSTGLYIELVDRARFPDWEGFLCGRGAVDRIVDDGPAVAGAGQQRVLDPSR